MSGKSAGGKRMGRVRRRTYVALCRALESEPPPAIVKMCRGWLGVQLVVV